MRALRWLCLCFSWWCLLCCAAPTTILECEGHHHCATGQRCQANRCTQAPAAEIRLKKLVCDHYLAGQPVVCEIQGEGFLRSDKAWIGCLPFDPQDSKRLEDTRWEIRGRWLCACGDLTIEANIRGNPYSNLDSGKTLEGECGCQPIACIAKGQECGEWLDENQKRIVDCGPCPTYATCQQGRCIGNRQHSARCKEGVTIGLDGLGQEEAPSKKCATGRCATRQPFAHDTCEEDRPPAVRCSEKADGTYCDGRTLITCGGGAQTSAQECRWACQPTPFGRHSSEGQARCFVRPSGYAMLRHKASGLCAVPALPLLGDAHQTHLVLRPCQTEDPLFYWKREETGELRHASQLCLHALWNNEGQGRCSTLRMGLCQDKPTSLGDYWLYNSSTQRLQIGEFLQMVPYAPTTPSTTWLHVMPEKSLKDPTQTVQAEWVFVSAP